MLVGRIFKVPDRRIGWVGECEVAGVWTQGLTRQEALANIAEVVELKIDKPGFKACVTEVGTDPIGGVTVWIEANDPAALVALILLEQRLTHRLSLADVADRLDASSRNAYAAYEQGRREPSISKLCELLTAIAPDIGLVFTHREYLSGLSRGLQTGWRERLETRRSLVRTANGSRRRGRPSRGSTKGMRRARTRRSAPRAA